VEQHAAEQEAMRLNAEHPERALFCWVAFPQKQGFWTVIKTPRGKHVDPLSAMSEAKPRPPQPNDPRTDVGRIPGYG
jgi:hypothetical protein